MLPAKLCTALAEELRDVRLQSELLAEVIFSDSAFALAHLDRLQDLDLMMQRVGEAAALLEKLAAGCGESAIDDIRLQSMQDRLRTMLLAA